jgi:hypothetical protein
MVPSVRFVAILALGTIAASCNRDAAKAENAAIAAPLAAASAGPVATPVPGAVPSKIDPEASKALDRMGEYMRTLNSFQISADTERDDVLDDGQRIQYAGRVEMLVQRPDRLRAEVTADRQQRYFFYDGKTFTMWARRVNYYGTVPAPSTLAELAETLANKYDIELPLEDLFYWGAPGRPAVSLQAAADIGPSQIQGVSCEHYAFRQDAVDWQVWIQQGRFPLPRKLVITTTSDAARPQYTSVLSWNLAPAYNDAAFKFEPPADAKKIAIAEVK